MLALLKLVDPKIWIALAIAAAVAIYTVGVYRAGGAGPRAEIVRITDGIESARKLRVAEDIAKTARSGELIAKLIGERHDAQSTRDAAWSAYYRLLGDAGSRPGAGEKPARTIARICDGTDDNERLSDALQRYRDEIRSVLDDLWAANQQRRRDIGQLLETAERQTADLDAAKALILGLRRINSTAEVDGVGGFR